MYLYANDTPPRSHSKFQLGAVAPAAFWTMGALPSVNVTNVRRSLPAAIVTRSHGARVFRSRRMTGLGAVAEFIDPETGYAYDSSGNLLPFYGPPMAPQSDSTPVSPGNQPGLQPGAQSAFNALWTNQAPSKSPLDYVSPQAAIAVGLDPQTVYDAWTKALARFPSKSAALASGIPAGVIEQLWQPSRAVGASTPASWLSQSLLGIPNTWLVAGGLGIAALVAVRGRGRR